MHNEQTSSPSGDIPAGSPSQQRILHTSEGEPLVETRSVSLQHSGPLPSPDQLHDYNEILPGAAERIVQMAEKEQAHRHEVNHRKLAHEEHVHRIIEQQQNFDHRLALRGQRLGFVFAVLALAGGLGAMYLGFGVGGTLLGGLPAAAIVYALTRKDHHASLPQEQETPEERAGADPEQHQQAPST